MTALEYGVDAMLTIFAKNLREKMGLISKTNVMINLFAKSSSSLSKKRQVFCEINKITVTSVSEKNMKIFHIFSHLFLCASACSEALTCSAFHYDEASKVCQLGDKDQGPML
jgi:hypothetical protein